MGCRVKPGKEMMMSYLICALTASSSDLIRGPMPLTLPR